MFTPLRGNRRCSRISSPRALAGVRIGAAARIEKRYSPLAVEHIMVRLRHNSGLALLLAAGLCLAAGEAPAQTAAPASATSATGAHLQKRHARGKKAAAVTETPQPPPAPLTPEQLPPTPPHVTYQNGLLTIDAENSTLSQVLRSVQAQTGASIEMPSSAANDRVVMQLGPGRPQDVLNTLLNGSRFNYIILGTTANPGAVQKVILTPRQSAPAAVNTAQNNPGQVHPPPDEPQDEEMPAPEAEADNPPEAQPVPAMPGRFRPGQVPMRPPETNEQTSDNGNQPNGGKTPEQLMLELQNLQQQQQRYQQQLNPANIEGQPQPQE